MLSRVYIYIDISFHLQQKKFTQNDNSENIWITFLKFINIYIINKQVECKGGSKQKLLKIRLDNFLI